jgi:hypothetical protein
LFGLGPLPAGLPLHGALHQVRMQHSGFDQNHFEVSHALCQLVAYAPRAAVNSPQCSPIHINAPAVALLELARAAKAAGIEITRDAATPDAKRFAKWDGRQMVIGRQSRPARRHW